MDSLKFCHVHINEYNVCLYMGIHKMSQTVNSHLFSKIISWSHLSLWKAGLQRQKSKTPRWEIVCLVVDRLAFIKNLHTSKLRCIFGESYFLILMVFMSLVFGASPEVKKLCIVNQGGRGPGLKRPCSASDRGSLTSGMQMFQKGMGMPSWCAWNKVKICAFFNASPWLARK